MVKDAHHPGSGHPIPVAVARLDAELADLVGVPATRRTDPAYGYGFTSRRSDYQRSTTAHHVEAIRNFLAMCDPDTGYIEGDPDHDGSDDVNDD